MAKARCGRGRSEPLLVAALLVLLVLLQPERASVECTPYAKRPLAPPAKSHRTVKQAGGSADTLGKA
jgi:hypothetical protein